MRLSCVVRNNNVDSSGVWFAVQLRVTNVKQHSLDNNSGKLLERSANAVNEYQPSRIWPYRERNLVYESVGLIAGLLELLTSEVHDNMTLAS
jgi:hypothetical protein